MFIKHCSSSVGSGADSGSGDGDNGDGKCVDGDDGGGMVTVVMTAERQRCRRYSEQQSRLSLLLRYLLLAASYVMISSSRFLGIVREFRELHNSVKTQNCMPCAAKVKKAEDDTTSLCESTKPYDTH